MKRVMKRVHPVAGLFAIVGLISTLSAITLSTQGASQHRTPAHLPVQALPAIKQSAAITAPRHGDALRVMAAPLEWLAGDLVHTGSTKSAYAPSPLAATHACAPPALGHGRMPWAETARNSSLRPRSACHLVGLAADEEALCRAADGLAGPSGELLLIVSGHDRTGRADALGVTLRSAARHLGPRVLLLAIDEAAAAVGVREGIATFRLASTSALPSSDMAQRAAMVAPRAAIALLRAGIRVILSVGSHVLFSGDVLGGLSRDTDVEVLSEGWDETTAGGHVPMLRLQPQPLAAQEQGHVPRSSKRQGVIVTCYGL